MIELLDVVDEQDNVLRVETRENVSKLHLIHRQIHVLVISTKGDILLQQRSATTKNYPGYWDASVGGHVRSGETYEQAAVREMPEEIGIDCDVKRLVRIADYHSYSTRRKANRRLFIYESDGPFKPDPLEVAKLQSYSPGHLQTLIKEGSLPLTEGFKRSFQLYSEHIARL